MRHIFTPSRPVRMTRVPEDVAETPGRQRFVLILDRMPTPAETEKLARHRGVCVVRDDWRGVARVVVDRAGPTLFEALEPVVRGIEELGLSAVRLDDQDWVTLAEIGERIGRSREAVRLWSRGRHRDSFPPPLNPGRDTSFYSWSEVAAWLGRYVGVEPPAVDPALRAANLALQLRALAGCGVDTEPVSRLLTSRQPSPVVAANDAV